IVGSRFVLNTQTTNPALQETVQLLENLLESCTTISDIHDSSPMIWESKW
ncbi:MAG: hypothetical protein GY796_12075, partial [Chloroflexi bacterium]|nr:hypothetical protein [Chloroflexota bacterium]